MSVDLDTACRVCLANNLNLNGIQSDLQEVYERLTREKYNKLGYPLSLCDICLSVLRKCHRFMETAQHTNNELEHWYKQQNEIKMAKPLNTYIITTQDPISLGNEAEENTSIPTPLAEQIKMEPALVKAEHIKMEPVHVKQEAELDLEVEILPIEVDEVAPTVKEEMSEDGLGCLEYVKVEMEVDRQTNENEVDDKDRICGDVDDDDGDKPFICEVCNYKCAQQWLLVRHMRTHTGEKHFSCEICDYKCVHKNDYTRHMRIHTGEKPFTCNFCDYKCAHKWSMIRHLNTHTGEKPFSCDYCDRRCSSRHWLTVHIRTHTGEKPFACELCAYKCSNSNDLTKHMKIHTGEKPYSCTVCEYKSARKDCLTAHMKTHTGEKPFPCEVCGFKFSQKRNLITHMRTHTGEKPFSCTICSYKCARKNNLNAHMKTHHSTEKSKEKRPKANTSQAHLD